MDTEMVPTFDTLMPNQEGEPSSNRSARMSSSQGRCFVRRPVPIDETANPALTDD